MDERELKAAFKASGLHGSEYEAFELGYLARAQSDQLGAAYEIRVQLDEALRNAHGSSDDRCWIQGSSSAITDTFLQVLQRANALKAGQ